ncbi:kinetochore protein Mis18 isoform 2 [Galdieria sulphuraria]|uniref:Kinetochore protein Mis18 isoform 2 n=1 Tax=Galdieria sulphuraria TaxID=130081 RepID=M2XX88_GALSU|nr:kinetochore protein Mis18 isoform 2 [Galdieria sulphuraria]EME28054.1 kinetochore protein Mis18 isoform 2 [Galdieria sulphuraria]|eukprot:XP_005704574.1 kinetochore protein Mis18 isoform 2 [Galdieria sulphuraria]
MVPATDDLKQAEEEKVPTETPSKAIFVLQCAHCKTLLGDTCSLISAQVELSAIVLTKAVNIEVEDSNFEISNTGVDSGSAFHLIKCSGCQSVVGRCYKATPRSLDHIRDMFTLFENNLLSYPLSCSMDNSRTEPSRKEDNQSENLYQVESDIRTVCSVICKPVNTT